jgi:hypothetical protein
MISADALAPWCRPQHHRGVFTPAPPNLAPIFQKIPHVPDAYAAGSGQVDERELGEIMTDDGGTGAADGGGDALSGETMVIRTWLEPNGGSSFRARITYGKATAGEPNRFATSDPDEVLDVVRQWLDAQRADN